MGSNRCLQFLLERLPDDEIGVWEMSDMFSFDVAHLAQVKNCRHVLAILASVIAGIAHCFVQLEQVSADDRDFPAKFREGPLHVCPRHVAEGE